MRQLLLVCIIVPNLCFAGIDVRTMYIKAVAEFSTCGNALMPWGGKGWQLDEAEKPYVSRAKLNRSKMQSEIDAEFYTEASLEKPFVIFMHCGNHIIWIRCVRVINSAQ